MMGQLGFHVQFEGLIADVEPSGFAWMAGLRQGSRLVEVCFQRKARKSLLIGLENPTSYRHAIWVRFQDCVTDQKYSKVTKTLAYFFFQINGMIVATLSHEQMIDFLRKPGSVSAVIVPPFQNGKPRKYVSVNCYVRERQTCYNGISIDTPRGHFLR